VVFNVPGLFPLVFGVPEGVGRMWVSIRPWLTTLTIWEVIIGATNSHIKDQIEFTIKRSIKLRLILPRVVNVIWEPTLRERVLVMLVLEHCLAIKLSHNAFLGPLKFICVERIAKILSVFVLLMSNLPGIIWISWTEVKGGSEGVDTASRTRGIITSALHDVDLTTGWPLAKLNVLRKHPNRWPYPVTLRQLSADLHSSILEVEGVNASQSGARDWIDIVSTGSGIPLTAIKSIIGTPVTFLTAPKTVRTGLKCLFSQEILGVSWLQMEDAVFDEGIGSVVVVNLKLPISTSTHRDLMLPSLEIQGIKIVLEYQLFSCGGTKECGGGHNL